MKNSSTVKICCSSHQEQDFSETVNAVHECYGVKMKRHQTTLGEDLLGRSLCASDTKIWPTLQMEQQFLWTVDGRMTQLHHGGS